MCRRGTRCQSCAYPLVNGVRGRCPECGEPFDLDDPATYREGPPRVSGRIVVTILLITLVPLLLAMMWLAGRGLFWW